MASPSMQTKISYFGETFLLSERITLTKKKAIDKES
jgi:hypothetical protein